MSHLTQSLDLLFTNANLATMQDAEPYGLMRNAALAVKGDRIAWFGSSNDQPPAAQCQRVIDCKGQLLTPGLIDCHTHLVYGGNRINEFEMRLNGASYTELAASGGIRATVAATRQASQQSLYSSAAKRLSRLLAEGVTCVEIKSGYGLDLATERKMLQVARQLGEILPVDVCTSFLGAHALPPEYQGKPKAYIQYLIDEMLPAIAQAGLADAVDAFCEKIAFSSDQLRPLFQQAQALGLAIKFHAEQLSHCGGAAMAAEFNALSVDHLEYLPEADMPLLAQAGTVAVMLPGAFYFLRETQPPPVDLLRKHHIPMAVATDANPGSSPLNSLLLAMNMASTLFGLTPSEALAGTTINAAKALGKAETMGSLTPNKLANLALWETDNPAELVYHMGVNLCRGRCYRGHFQEVTP